MKSHSLLLFVSGLCLTFLSFLPARADTVNCNPSEWKHFAMQGGQIIAKVERLCRLQLQREGNLPGVQEHFIASAKAKAQSVQHSKLVEGGTQLEATEKIVSNNGTIAIHSLTDFLMASPTTFMVHMYSLDLNGTGNARYTQKIDNTLVVKQASPQSYSVVITSQITLRKPSFVPSGFIKRRIKESLDQDIGVYTDTVNRSLLKHL